MIEQQIRTWEVLDQKILDLLEEVHREDYVPVQYRNLALADIQIPLGDGEVMMAPKLEARLIQSLDIQPTDKILEIGTGSGYLTSLLAKLGKEVISIEINSNFHVAAQSKLVKHGFTNITLERGDGVNGWSAKSPYDVIVATGSLPLLNNRLQEQLTIGGRLFVIVGESPVMEALLITRENNHEWSTESMFETDLPALLNAPRVEKFVF